MRLLTFPILCFVVVMIGFLSKTYHISPPAARVYLADRDFRNLYTGALLIKNHETTNFYEVGTQYDVQRSFIPEIEKKVQLMPYNRPPVVAWLLSPLASLPYTRAFRAIMVINALLIVTCLVISMKIVRKNQYESYVPLLFAGFFPVWVTLLQGQLSLLLILIFIGVGEFTRRGDERGAGLTAAALIAFPQLAFVPFLYFLVTRKYKTVLWYAGGIAAGIIVSMCLIGLEGILMYPKFLFFLSNAGETYTMHPRSELTVLSLLHMIFRTDAPTPVIRILWIVISAAVCVWFVCFAQRREKNVSLDFAVMTVVAVLISAHTNYHDLVVLLAGFLFYLQTATFSTTRWFLMLGLPLLAALFSALFFRYPGAFPVAAAAIYLLRGRLFPKNLKKNSR